MSDRAKKADWLFLVMAVWILCANLFGGPILRYLPMGVKLISSEVIYLIPVLLYLVVSRLNLKTLIPHETPKLSTVGMTLLFVALLQPLMVCLNVFTMLFSTNYVIETQTGLQGISVLVQLLCIAVVPAVCEEFMFRGVFHGSYQERGILAASVFSGLVFGLFHLNFNQFGYAFMLGVAFALLIEGTGSIFYSVIGHFAINGWSVLVSAFSDDILKAIGSAEDLEEAAESMNQEMLVNTFCVYVVVAFVCTCLAGAVYIWIVKHSRREAYLREHWKAPKDPETGKRFHVSPVFAVGVVLCIGFMIYRDFLA